MQLSIRKNYMHEFGGYVYQVTPSGGSVYTPFIEPFVRESEAKAFIAGFEYAQTINQQEVVKYEK